ncbi:hypothetical protein N7466_004283 [Penicillium verhagenii]|uniref:uncharacterized protein n=1 Tax=Penicillium verhagenii TaxID=1562060 RepID=UPI0025457740|nr:uncharacterized protein N7466_004283 [Penicillium verhagenii]KAJ5934736.1 hypothetical protein N7466_004283 [Penicillium verhagenii]
MSSVKPQSVAIIGTGMAGLITAYILRNDPRARFDVEVFEKQKELSLDSASFTVKTNTGTEQRVDLPMRAFASGFYDNLKRMYDYLGIEYGSQRFIFPFSTISESNPSDIYTRFIHSSHTHQFPLRPRGPSWISWLVEILYLLICHIWIVICSFFIEPKEATSSRPSETFGQYAARIRLPQYFVKHYYLPIMSAVTTCPHDALMNFPAIDLVDYQAKTFRKPHYTVIGGVSKVQDKLSKGLNVRYSSAAIKVQNVGSKVQLTWRNDGADSAESKLYDHVIMAVTPDVVRAIFAPLRSALAVIPTATIPAYIHRDFDRLPKCSQLVDGGIRSEPGLPLPERIHLCSNSTSTEFTHEHLSSVIITTSPIVPIDPSKIEHSVTFTRTLRTPTSRKVTNEIFGSRSQRDVVDSKQWQNGDGNVWLVGSWCWDGMVLLEGCIASALRVAEKLDVEVPWAL